MIDHSKWIRNMQTLRTSVYYLNELNVDSIDSIELDVSEQCSATVTVKFKQSILDVAPWIRDCETR